MMMMKKNAVACKITIHLLCLCWLYQPVYVEPLMFCLVYFFRMEMHKEIYEVRKKQTRKFKDCLLSRKSVEALLLTTEPDHFQKYYTTPPEIPNSAVVCSSVSLLHNSLYVAGMIFCFTVLQFYRYITCKICLFYFSS